MDQEDQIIDFLEGNLDAGETSAIEARIAADPDFAKEVEQYRQVWAGLAEYSDFQSRKAEVDEVAAEVEAEIRAEENHSPKQENKRIRPGRWWAAAAAVVLLAVVTYTLLPRYGADYYQSNYSGLISDPGSLRGTGAVDSILPLATESYNQNDFAGCIQLLEGGPSNSAAVILLSSAYLQEGRTANAIESLLSMPSDSTHIEYKRWLLAIAYLHQGEEEKAKTYLQEIVDDPNRRYKRSEAEDILQQLGRFWR